MRASSNSPGTPASLQDPLPFGTESPRSRVKISDTCEEQSQTEAGPSRCAESPLLTTATAAEYLSVSPRMIKALMTAGRIPFVKIGRATRIQRRDLDDYIAQNRRRHRQPVRRVS